MITEVDTNVLSAVISDEEGAVELGEHLYGLVETDEMVISLSYGKHNRH